MNNRVFVTGIGAITSNGRNMQEVCESCIKGISGIKPSKEMKRLKSSSEYAAVIEVDTQMTYMEKFIHISKKALEEMFEDAKINKEIISKEKEKSAFIIGTANLPSLPIEDQYNKLTKEKCKIETMKLNYRNSDGIYELNELIGNKGDCYYINSACASGTMAAGIAYDLIKSENINISVVAGVDILSEVSIAGFNSMNNVCEKDCKPFDKERTGLNLGEAAVFFLIESEKSALARGAKIYAEIFGYDSKNDAYHITSPDPTGEVVFTCMNNVLKQYPLQKGEVIYVNAHGTGTLANDEMELNALCKLVETNNDIDKVWFSSTKSMLGHCLGAAGAIELAVCILCMQKEKMPLSISVENKMDMPDYTILVTKEEESVPFDVCISNSYAFAGNLSCIGICKYKEEDLQYS